MNHPNNTSILNVNIPNNINTEESLNSNINLNDGNQNQTNQKKKKKNLERKIENEAGNGAINLYKLGDVKLAEIHSYANRPLKKLNELDRNCNF